MHKNTKYNFQGFIPRKLRAQKYKIHKNTYSRVSAHKSGRSWEQFSLLSAQAALVETHKPLMIDDDKDFFGS